MRIKILPEAIVNKIAAGEVIDRPAAVLKELMENSLDAGSRSVRVRLKGAMGKFICVADDGCGLSADDALLALERHATSKINTLEDIEGIATMGFRGEALPSIAGVSHLTLETRRPEDEMGARVEVSGGAVVSSTAVSLPPGTTVTVQRLFFNTPVRKKFLRSEATEKGHLVKVFLKLALVHPETRMILEYDDRETYVLPAADDLGQRLRAVFGSEFLSGMTPVRAEEAGLRLEGYVADPQNLPPGSYQYFFVNGRPVEDRFIQAAVREGIGGLASRWPRPPFVLHLTLDPRRVDVNVHPAKREVRFNQPGLVSTFLARAVASSFGASAAPKPAAGAFRPSPSPPGAPLAGFQLGFGAGDPGAASLEPPPVYSRPSPPEPAAEDSRIVCLGQVMCGYLVAAEEDRLLLIDQHAAHERILFERVLKRFEDRRDLSQDLLWPEEIKIQPQDREGFERLLPLMEKVGCRLEAFGPGTWRVISLPPEIGSPQLKAFINGLLSLLEETDGTAVAGPSWWEKPAALIACHAAVKLGDSLKPEDMSRLVSELMACRDPHHCPHGRPTMVVLDREGFEKLFLRR